MLNKKNNDTPVNEKLTAVHLLSICVLIFMVGLFVLYMYTEHRTYFTDRGTVTVTTVVTDSYGRYDINSASVKQLSDIEGIGRKLGQNIVDFVEENGGILDMNDLLDVDGIGEAKLEILCEKFYVDKYSVTTSLSSVTTTAPTQTTISAVSSESISSETTTYATTTKITSITPKKTTTKSQTTVTKTQRRRVNINTADVAQLCDCLLIEYNQAVEIVSLREEIGGYVNILEILYCESISDSLYITLEQYLTIE